MIKYLAYIIGKEEDGQYFNTAREAYDYINSLSVPNLECKVILVEIPE